MVQDASEIPFSLTEGVREADRRGLSGYEDDYGNWVDPRPVQLGAIREGFREASGKNDFDVFEIVNPDMVKEDKPLESNFNRVYSSWESQAEDVSEEIARQLEEMGYDLDDEHTQ